jgi:hypothetical protein
VVLLDNDWPDADDVYVKHYRLTFGDAVAPAITCPADATVECASPWGVGAEDAQLASFFSGVSATDACDETPSIGNDAPPVFGLGATAVTFTATDDAGNASSCQAAVQVRDTVAPAIQCPHPGVQRSRRREGERSAGRGVPERSCGQRRMRRRACRVE